MNPTDLEYLDRLVELGEGLLHPDLKFAQAEALLSKGYANISITYKSGIILIVPTTLGRSIAEKRKISRAQRLKAKEPKENPDV